MRILVTGANGFLGWHTRARLHALTDHHVASCTRHNWKDLPDLVRQADAIVHTAGVNRGAPDEVRDGNVALAQDLARAIAQANRAVVVVYANSIQARESNPYGIGKRGASGVIASATAAVGGAFVDVVLPNLFGEHARPRYNSFVATFIHAVVEGSTPHVQDRQIELLHVQAAAQALIGALENPVQSEVYPLATATTVSDVLDTLQRQHATYRHGELPVLSSALDVNLFNALRAQMVFLLPFPIVRRVDERGALVEAVRAHGSMGQAFVSTTRPGVTRGQHFHLRKFERFAVVSGEALISVRRILTNETMQFHVTGGAPAAVDMPTLWAHNITNVGDSDLVTAFWTNELFDPADPDTYAEEV